MPELVLPRPPACIFSYQSLSFDRARLDLVVYPLLFLPFLEFHLPARHHCQYGVQSHKLARHPDPFQDRVRFCWSALYPALFSLGVQLGQPAAPLLLPIPAS